MNFVNRHLAARYTNGTGTFVTAFYGIYDPAKRELIHASAGHCPPRVRRGRDGTVVSPTCDGGLPLGIEPDERYADHVIRFERGDVLVLYTDGVTEARRPADNDLFGVERLDAVLQTCRADAGEALMRVLAALDEFTSSSPPGDDQTLLAASFT
jgi:sigma-B regulation protein RsbU (phosphoserine phosphatase)